ncbi:MAG TPA: hypothetical protein VG733_10730 [Chthoniobacteraceae bacterium]|nr:hypothetical protein [Chthoniobacteraceae bacterium]
MAGDDLANLIRLLRAEKHPEYALLPWSEYQAKWKEWGLPALDLVKGIAPAP